MNGHWGNPKIAHLQKNLEQDGMKTVDVAGDVSTGVGDVDVVAIGQEAASAQVRQTSCGPAPWPC